MLDFEKDYNTVSIKPIVYNDSGLINTTNSVEIYIDNILNSTIDANGSLTYTNIENTYPFMPFFRRQ